jgi:L-aspartate oxidase
LWDACNFTRTANMAQHCDVLIIGSGVAGLTFALDLPARLQVTVVTKRQISDGSTDWAQGGIAAVLASTDSFDHHIRDTHVAGAGMSHERAVELCVRGAPERIAALRAAGAEFDLAGGAHAAAGTDLDLHLEGGHSARRIVHRGDMTGREIERALVAEVRKRANVRVLEEHMAVDVIMHSKFGGPDRSIGAYVLDVRTGQVTTWLAHHTVLASGGAGKVYLYTTNPDVSTGDGVAMGYRAGAEVANMEFYQFHPTCLYNPSAKSFLISEALRGEGAVLKRVDGTRFMADHDARLELAPRDIVARAIDYEMKKTGADHVYLDISHRGEEFCRQHFPGIYEQCLKYGLNIAKEPIPVVPAAHYMCGGISTDLEGRTSIPGLWAIGECAHTGLHGANRLASNSLLEGMVLGQSEPNTLPARFQRSPIGTAAPRAPAMRLW